MTILRVEVSGFEAALSKLTSLSSAVDVPEILDEVEAMMLNRIRARYLAEQDPDYHPWKPSAAGLARRAKGGTGTLFRKGTLFHSINAYRISDEERGIGTDVPYAKYHQLGIGQEKREFLGFGDSDVELAEKLILLRISEAID